MTFLRKQKNAIPYLNPTDYTDSGIYVMLGPLDDLEPKVSQAIECMPLELPSTASYDKVLEYLKRNNIWNGPEGSDSGEMVQLLAVYYARFGFQNSDKTAQQRYNDFLEAYSECVKTLTGDQKSDPIDLEKVHKKEEQINKYLVSWFRGLVEVRQKIAKNAEEFSATCNKRCKKRKKDMPP